MLDLDDPGAVVGAHLGYAGHGTESAFDQHLALGAVHALEFDLCRF
jgi:hypothetical protein